MEHRRPRALAALLLALAAPGAHGLGSDAISLLQSVAQGSAQPSRDVAVHRSSGRASGRQEPMVPSYVVGETVEVKSHRGSGRSAWVLCYVMGPGTEPGTYDIVIPGTAVMRSVPVAMLRERRKSTTPMPLQADAEAPEAGGIDGEPDELVELLIRKGPRAGTWAPGRILGRGRLEDTYNVLVETTTGGTQEVKNVPGSSLRKALTTTTTEAPLDEPESYQVGDWVEIQSEATGEWIRCSVSALGSKPDTYTLRIGNVGSVSDAPRAVLRRARTRSTGSTASAAKSKELTTRIFEVGENVLAKIVSGDLAGSWLKAKIRALGMYPFTYIINFTDTVMDWQHHFTYQELLRTPDESFRRRDMSSYEPGEPVEYISMEPTRTQWNQAIVFAKGKAQDSYDLISASNGTVRSVAVELMRKAYIDESTLPKPEEAVYRAGDAIEYRNYRTGDWSNGTILGVGTSLPGTYDIGVRDFGGMVVPMMPPELLRRPVTSFNVGDDVEVQSTKNVTAAGPSGTGKDGNSSNVSNSSSVTVVWIRGTVVALGRLPDTYDVRIQGVGVVRGARLHRMRKASPVPERSLLVAYELGEEVELRGLMGESAGAWVRGAIAGRGGIRSTYNVSIPGAGISPNVPIEVLRKVPSSRFKVGEFVKVRIPGPDWAYGMISGRGMVKDMFDISYWGSGLVTNVALELIRKVNWEFKPEELPLFEVGALVKARDTTGGPDMGRWLDGTVKSQGDIVDTPEGPRPQTYTLSIPSRPEVGDIAVPAELIVRDHWVLRPITGATDLQVNDTVRLKGYIGPRGAQWVKVYILRNGTGRETYDVHLPGVGVFSDNPIELLRRLGTQEVNVAFRPGERVELKNIYGYAADGRMWHPATVVGPGVRPNTYDVMCSGGNGTSLTVPSQPMEILRRADGHDFRPLEKVYFKGEIVELKDMLGMISPSSVAKATFRVLGPGEMADSFNIEGPSLGTIQDVPNLLLQRVKPEELKYLENTIEVGDHVGCSDIDKPGSRRLCMVEAEGDRPGTFNVKIPGFDGIFPNIPVSRLYKKRQEAAGPNEQWQAGDAVEFYDDRHEVWVDAEVIGKGDKPHALDVRVGDTGAIRRSVPEDKVRAWGERETTTVPTLVQDEPLSVGDGALYLGPGMDSSNSNSWMPCVIMGEGQVPLTFNIGFSSGLKLNNVQAKYIYKRRAQTTTTQAPEDAISRSMREDVMVTIQILQAVLKQQEEEQLLQLADPQKAALNKELKGTGEDPDVHYDVGERAEVLASQGEYKGQWAPCEITSVGRIVRTYNIRLLRGGDVTNVGTHALRKLVDAEEAARIREASSCTEDDRRRMTSTISTAGLFSNLPQECSSAMGLMGFNQKALARCAQRKLSISAQCAQCPVEFAKEVTGFRQNCLAKCGPMLEACQRAPDDPTDCVAKLADCMICTKEPLVNMLTCMGIADPSVSSKVSQLSEAAASGRLFVPGTVEGLLGAEWVAAHHALLEPFLGPFLVAPAAGAGAGLPGQAAAAGAEGGPAFYPGDKAEIRVQRGPFAGMWADCVIAGAGRLSGTFNVHIPSAPEGKRDIQDVSASLLRRSEETEDHTTTPPNDEEPA